MKHVSSSSSDVLGVSVAEDLFLHNISLRHFFRPSMKVPSCKVSRCLDPKLVSRPLALRRYSFLKVRAWEADRGGGLFFGRKKNLNFDEG